jgi:flagellar hook-length control protein FliK
MLAARSAQQSPDTPRRRPVLELISSAPEWAAGAPVGGLRGRSQRGVGGSAELGFAEWLELAGEDRSGSESGPSRARPRSATADSRRLREKEATTSGDEAAPSTVTEGDEDPTSDNDQAGAAVTDVGAAPAEEARAAGQQSLLSAAADAGDAAAATDPVAVLSQDEAPGSTAGRLLEAFRKGVAQPGDATARADTGGESGSAGAAPQQGAGVSPAATEAPLPALDLSQSLGLLNSNELIDPRLVVDLQPDQLLSRLQQAMSAGAARGLMDGVADTVLPQVIRGLATLVRNGAAEMRLQLQPADLGEIELRVRTVEGIVRGEMMVQNPEIKQLIDANMDRLRAALAEEGLDLAGFDVDVGTDARFSDARGQGESGAGYPRPVGSTEGVDPASESAQTAPVGATSGDHAVDYTI